MRFLETGVSGAWVVDPSPHQDNRGYFQRAWCDREFRDHGVNFVPVQANMAFSLVRGTIRGMHFQTAPALEAKLVRCTRGAVFDVVLDLRPESPTYGEWYGVELTADNGRMLFVPELCAHGCQSLEKNCEIHYMASAFFAPDAARGVRFDDPAFAIDWPLPAAVVSDQDRSWPLVKVEEPRVMAAISERTPAA
jgi:dTDP-4-dehydrorhamnose 3,5-epimerase